MRRCQHVCGCEGNAVGRDPDTGLLLCAGCLGRSILGTDCSRARKYFVHMPAHFGAGPWTEPPPLRDGDRSPLPTEFEAFLTIRTGFAAPEWDFMPLAEAGTMGAGEIAGTGGAGGLPGIPGVAAGPGAIGARKASGASGVPGVAVGVAASAGCVRTGFAATNTATNAATTNIGANSTGNATNPHRPPKDPPPGPLPPPPGRPVQPNPPRR